jgi:serine/threonine protein kinase
VTKVAVEVGSTANRYQILAKLAAGGMAEIFLARGASVGGVERYCVLKRILRERASDAQFVQMFVDEARLAAQLQHPNIASVYDVGMLGESYFFTMEYVHGETVGSLIQRALERRRPLPLACVLTIIAGAAAGLHHAHERNANDGRPLGIVHRDVSPSNLMVSYEGNVKVVDFGVAKAADRAVETKSGTVKGKISYLSPEQCRDERVDRRSDLFSLGIVMWEMLTGARLYRRSSDFENMTAIVKEAPPPPSSRRPEVPRAVDEIVLRLLAKSVTARFQAAGEVVEAIEDASMRARTILSTSAVSRLVRDLFGERAEPWLELSETLPFQPIMLASRPISKELEHTQTDPAELELAGVLDLSSSDMRLESDDDPDPLPAPSAMPATPSAPIAVSPAAARFARAATPVAARSPAPAPIAMPAAPAHAGSNPPNTTLLGVSAPPSAAAPSSAFPTPTRLPVQTASPARAGSVWASSPVIAEPRASSLEPKPVSGSGPRLAQNLPAFATTSQARTQVRARRPPASRVTWPLVAVIATAATIGVVVAWISMRPGERHAPEGSNAALEPAPLPVADAGIPDASDAPERAQPGIAPPDLRDASMTSDREIDVPAPEASAAPSLPVPPIDASPPPPTDAAPSRRPPVNGGVHRRPPGDAPRPSPVDAAAPAPARTNQPSFDSLSKLFHSGDYPTVVRVCSAALVKPELASVCLMAACQERNTTQAKRWLSAADPARRDQLVAYCKGNGDIDIGTRLEPEGRR